MSQASALEKEMLELVNAERAKVGVDPLTFDDNLNSAAEDHSSWMLENDIFDHTGVDGTRPEDRAVDAGYVLEGRSAVGENIGWHSTGGEPGLSDDVVLVHEGLMNSPAHKAAILNPLFTEIGIGIEDGDFFIDGEDWDSVMVTQNFGTTEAEDGTPAEPEVEATPAAPDDTATVEETETPEEMTPEDSDEIVATAEDRDDEQPQDTVDDDVAQQPEDVNDTLIFTGNDGGSFDWSDWLNLDFLDNLSTGSGNNNGNGNTGGGTNGQGNGFGNNGTGVNGTGNGNGNSDWWNDQFELTIAAAETNAADTASNASTDWSWGSMDFADLDQWAPSFDDCFMM
ncbi:CAP domain-containing protein [Roseobacter sp.]|uniref:CAP domain-containing protein n=1 Tax=Roseobacter sp. TaxID=1907202 RepID=UPI003299062E